ncbi:MAG: hypothetical protein AAE983_03010 [Thermoplasmataceae archaeon]
MICPTCGSGRTEYVKEQFQENYSKRDSNEIKNEAGIDSKVRIARSHVKGEENQSGLVIPRRERWACHDCGNSFNEKDPFLISGHRVWMGEQFFSDYYRLTALSDMKALFPELKKRLPKGLTAEINKFETPKYPFEFDIRIKIRRNQYVLTCFVGIDTTAYVKLEGMTRN